MEKKVKERLDEFSDDRFMDHINNLAEIGMEAGRYEDMFQTIFFITDLHKMVTEIKKS